MTKKLISVIIVNWNGREYLSYCFPSLERIDYPNFEVIVVDNGSTDGSVEEIKRMINDQQLMAKKKNQSSIINHQSSIIKLIENKENFGFAEANNIGFKEAKGEYILILNNDTKVAPDFLTKLVNVIEKDKKIGVVQPKIVFMDSGKLQAGGAFLTNTGFLYHFGFGKDPNDKKYNQPMEIFSANGSCMLVRREVIEKVGLFDSDFFCYFEETDFCWRVWLTGYKILYVPEAVIYHKGSQTAQRLESSFVEFHSFKNRICSLIKNLGFLELFRILPVHLLFSQLAALSFLMTGKFANVWAIQKAFGWNVLYLKETLEKRRKIQNKIRRVSDRKLIPKIKKSVRPLYYYYHFSGLGKYRESLFVINLFYFIQISL